MLEKVIYYPLQLFVDSFVNITTTVIYFRQQDCSFLPLTFPLAVLDHSVNSYVIKKWTKNRAGSEEKERNPFPQEQCSTGKVIFVREDRNDVFGRRTLTNSFD